MIDIKNIKAIVMDFDNTLYTDANWQGYGDYYIKFLESIGITNADILYEELREKYKGYDSTQRTYLYLKDNNKPVDKFIEFLKNNVYDFMHDGIRVIDYKVIDNLSKKYPLYLLSLSSEFYLKHYLKLFNIDVKNYKAIYSCAYGDKLKKDDYFKELIKNTGLNPSEILMVGDNYNSDIEPAEKLGLQTFLVNDVSETEEFFKKLIQ